MQQSYISILIGVIIILGVGGLVFSQNSERILSPSPDSSGDSALTDTESSSHEDELEEDEDLEDEDESDDDSSGSSSSGGSTSGTTETPTTPPSSGGITAADVASHNSRTSCWSSINGSVYDLTSWIPKHPGGEQRILSICGIDGSAKFNGQHGKSSKIAGILAGFKIGVLAN